MAHGPRLGPLAIGAVLALVACGDQRETAAPSAPAREPARESLREPSPEPNGAPEPESSAAAAEPAGSRTERPRAAGPSPEQRREVARRVREARRLARGGRWQEAFAAYERALAIDPSSPRLRCETGYAAFRAGRLEEADRYVSEARRALPDLRTTPERMRVPLAMCLYNAGLVHEARGRTAEAREAYEASLSLRPNDTVRARLDALGPAPPPENRSAILRFDGAAEDAIVARLTRATCMARYARLAEVTGDGPAEPPGSHLTFDEAEAEECVAGGSPRPPRIRRPTMAQANASAPLDAFVVTIAFEDTPPVVDTWLVLRAGARAVAGRLASSPNFTAIDCAAAGLVRFEWIDAVPGGPPELVVEHEACEVTADSWQCESTELVERGLFVCRGDDSFVCASVPIASVRTDWWSNDCEDGMPADEGERAERGYRTEASLRDGALVVREVTGTPWLRFPAGRIAVDDLLAREDLRWEGI